MQKKLGEGWVLALLALSVSLFLPDRVLATPGTAAASHGAVSERGHFSAGEEIARTVTLTTGVPISPMLGVSALGAWRWWQTPEVARAALPWYARPWFWGPGI